jgi:hypothetical protein
MYRILSDDVNIDNDNYQTAGIITILYQLYAQGSPIGKEALRHGGVSGA